MVWFLFGLWLGMLIRVMLFYYAGFSWCGVIMFSGLHFIGTAPGVLVGVLFVTTLFVTFCGLFLFSGFLVFVTSLFFVCALFICLFPFVF